MKATIKTQKLWLISNLGGGECLFIYLWQARLGIWIMHLEDYFLNMDF
jgi:hypothetical protein